MSVQSAGIVGFDLILNGGKYEQQVASFQNKANYASEKISGSFKKIGTTVATALSVKVITAFGKECTELGSDLAEVQNVVDVTFTSMNQKLNEWSKSAVDSYGLSETMAKKYAGLYGSMASAFGFAEGQAYDMATTLAGLSGDIASFYNISQDEAYTKLKSVFSGETEALKDLGVIMNQSALDSYALANGFGKTVQQMTEAEKVSLRYSFVLDQLSNAQGDFTRTQDSWANQVRVLQLRFDSLKATIGQGLITALTPAVKFLNTMIERVQVLADAFSSMMTKLFGASDSTADAVGSTVMAEQLLTDSASESADAVDNVTDSINKSAKGSVASFDKLNVMSTASASTSGTSSGTDSANSPLTGSVNSDVSKATETLDSKFTAFFENFYEKSGFKDFVDEVQNGINNVDWTSIEKNCKSILKSSQPIAKSLLVNTSNTGKSALKTFGTYAGGIVSVTGKSIQTVSGGIADWLEKDNEKIVDFIEDTNENLQNGFSNLDSFFDSWFDLLGGSIDRMRPQMQRSISNLLSGCTDLVIGVGTVVTDGFEIASENLVNWIEKDSGEISLFFDNIQLEASEMVSVIGDVFSDMGTIISDWWNGEGGSSSFNDVCEMFTNIGTTFMNVWNSWIDPVLGFFTSSVQSLWNNTLSPVFGKVVSIFGKVGECIASLWNDILSPFVNWFVNILEPVFSKVCDNLKSKFENKFSEMGNVLTGFQGALEGVLDFLTGIFSGDWDKAWKGVQNRYTSIWNMICTSTINSINRCIDGINHMWSGVYEAITNIINSVGDIAGAIGSALGNDNWGWEVPSAAPQIPHFAKGAIVKAPTLAVVGDNPGAGNGDPEVISPLSKLQSMMNTSSGQDLAILTQILDYLKRIYEMFVIFRNNGGNMYEFIATLNGEAIFEEMIRQNKLYKKRTGSSAF